MCSKKSPIPSILRWNRNLAVWNTTMKCISMLVVLVGIVNVAEFLLFFALSSCDNGQVDFRICKIHANKYFELLILVFFFYREGIGTLVDFQYLFPWMEVLVSMHAQINFSSQNRYRVHYLEICRRIVKEGKRVFLYWVENILLSP